MIMKLVSDPILDLFLDKFIVPLGNTPADIKARMLYFAEVINESNPDLGEGKDVSSQRHVRKMAKQSLKRLIRRYPHQANQLVLAPQDEVAA
jgi:hypothetical protein